MPRYIQGFQMPTFPSTWYHATHGAKEIATYDEWLALDDGWKATPGEADMARTEMQAQMAIASGAADAAKREQQVVRNSAQNEEDMKRREAAAAAPPAQEPKREPPPAEHKPEQPQEDHRERRR